jgi:hypothetical protein
MGGCGLLETTTAGLKKGNAKTIKRKIGYLCMPGLWKK